MADPSRRALRVLVTSTPGVGHLGPLAPLARALSEAGHEVLWATAPEACERVRGMGFQVVAAGMDVGERVAMLAPQMPEIMALDPRERRSRLFTGFFGQIAAPRMHADLAAVFTSFRPHVVVHEMAELAAAPMATGRSVAHVTVAFSGALAPVVLDRALASTSMLWASEAVVGAGTGEMLGQLYLHPFPASFGPPPSHPNVGLIRPGSMAAHAAQQVPDWMVPLGRARPLVYVTAGTEATALQAPWGATFEALAQLDVDAVATIGALLDPATFGLLPPNVTVERFLPQQLLLERASVVVSHAGAGTVLGAALHGVPQLLCPIAADQWDNADAVARSGAGVVCEAGRRGAADLASGLRRLLDDPAVKAAAAAVAGEVAEMPTAADHVAAIEALAR